MRSRKILALVLLAAACGDDDGPTGSPSRSIEIVGSSQVAGTPLDTVPEQLAVRVTDPARRPLAGVQVTWSTPDGGSLVPASPETDEDGVARAEWVLGWPPGRQEARATLGEGEVAVFSASAEGFQAVGLSTGDGHHQCGIAPDGALFCWGPNSQGQLGDGTTTPSDSPVAAVLEHPVRQVVTSFAAAGAGSFHSAASRAVDTDDFTCALTSAGEVYCWGGNDGGQLGNGTFEGSRSPVQPSLPAGAYKSLSAMSGGVCAVADGGDAYCWGVNWGGRFGIGRTESVEPVPVRVVADFAWSQLALGDDRACGVQEGGQVHCWGSRPEWLGIDAETATVSPMPVLNSPPMDSVTLSGWHQCGITAEHVTHCWGSNSNIGFVTSDTLIPYPVALETAPPLRSLHSTFKPTFGLGTDDRGYWWGPPPHATGGGPEQPVMFSTEVTLRAIGTNESQVCGAEATTGTVYCWTMGLGAPLAVAVPPPSGEAEVLR
jgi:hypothetical protein